MTPSTGWAAPSADGAASLANAVAEATLTQNQTYVTASQASQRKLLLSQLDQINQQIAAAQAAIAAAHNAVPAKSDSGPLAQLNLAQNQYQATYARMQDLDVQQAGLISGFTIEQLATPPAKPADPDPVRYVGVGVVLGLVVGFLLALLAERFRDRVMDGAELAEVTGSELVLAVDYWEAPVVIGSYGLLSPGSLEAAPDVPVDDLAMDLAEAAASEHRRVLVVPSGPGRALREVNDRGPGRQLQPRPRSAARGADLTIRCASPLARPSLWLKPSAGPAVLVAVRNRTRFSEARRTAELLRHLGLDPVASVLLTRVAQGRPKPQLAAESDDPIEGASSASASDGGASDGEASAS